MDRRQALAGTAAWFAPIRTGAQANGRLRLVGVLVRVAVPDAQVRWFSEELSKLGWPVGSIAFEFRGAEKPLERFPQMARELVALGVDLIVVPSGTSAVLAARAATSSIPIVAIGMADPTRYGLAKTLSQPSQNVTGITDSGLDGGKWLELSREFAKSASRIAVIADATNITYAGYARQLGDAARRLGITSQMVSVSDSDQRAAIEAMKHERAEVVILAPSAVWWNDIIEWAARNKVPVVGSDSYAADQGALVSYGRNLSAVWQRAAVFVDRLLRGTKPADLPFEEPTRYELVINKRSARGLGLTLPQSMLLRADRFVE